MAKKKKNAHYTEASKQTEKKEKPVSSQRAARKSVQESFGVKAWLVYLCVAMLGVGFALYAVLKDTAPGWLTVLDYVLTGAPAAILAAGQQRLGAEERSNRLLKWLFVAMAIVYLVSALTLAAQLLRR